MSSYFLKKAKSIPGKEVTLAMKRRMKGVNKCKAACAYSNVPSNKWATILTLEICPEHD